MLRNFISQNLISKTILAMILLSLCVVNLAQAQGQVSDRDAAILDGIGFDQNLEAQLPLDVPFLDEHGQEVQLGDYFGDKPVILTMVYYECPMLCTLVLNGLLQSLSEIDLDIGNEFEVISISIDPDETPDMALEKKDLYINLYGKDDAASGWHFLTGDEENIKRVTETVGFHYIYDERNDEYAHPSGLVILTPDGKVARYFYGIEYLPTDLRLGLVEASQNKIGSPVDQILLTCYHYDPETGQYTLAVENITRIAGMITVLVIAIPLTLAVINERRKQKSTMPDGPELQT